MAVRVTFNISAPDFDEISKRGRNKMHKAAGTAAFEDFRQSRIDKRFDGSVDNPLQRQPRDEWYENLKARRGNRGKAHRKSGKTARQAKTTARIRITPKRMGVSLSLGPQYGRRRSLTLPDMRAEIENRFTREETTKILSLYGQEYAAQLEDQLATVRRRKQIT
jgi:hypothetical protein